MERQYLIYKITSISGKEYIGYTSLTLGERLRQHIKRANSNESLLHPFYNDIRTIGKEGFTIEALNTTTNRIEAMTIEKEFIGKIPVNISYNLSPGGVDDASFGGRIFWERLNNDPKARASFLKKLSDIKKANDWSDYEALAKAALAWRKEHPQEGYKNSCRAIRIANKSLIRNAGKVDDRPRKVKLMWKYKRTEMNRANAIKLWAGRDEEQREEVGEKISKAQKERMSKFSTEEKRQMTEKARDSIDRKKQGAAASVGIKKFWVELKADPERYEEYVSKRTASLMKTLQEDKTC